MALGGHSSIVTEDAELSSERIKPFMKLLCCSEFLSRAGLSDDVASGIDMAVLKPSRMQCFTYKT